MVSPHPVMESRAVRMGTIISATLHISACVAGCAVQQLEANHVPIVSEPSVCTRNQPIILAGIPVSPNAELNEHQGIPVEAMAVKPLPGIMFCTVVHRYQGIKYGQEGTEMGNDTIYVHYGHHR